MPSWAELERRSQPVPPDPSRGHQLHIASWKVQDGGVVQLRYLAMCRCYWKQRFPTPYEATARAAYDRHLDG